MPTSLLVVHVHVHVQPQHVDAFREATLANARESVKEPGIARFDVVQDTEDPTRFVLVEVYRTPRGPRRAQGDRPLPDVARHRGAR